MFLVDAHLDLAYNALGGRDVLQPASRQKPDEQGTPTVGLPDLRRGKVGLICGTIFCQPQIEQTPGYETPEQASRAGWSQMRWYQEQFQSGQLREVLTRDDVPEQQPPNDPSIATILLLEGADPILDPSDAHRWFQAGLRMVGLAWKQTRYAGGTGAPGPLTEAGKQLVAALDVLGIIHDASHLAEESFWQLLDLSNGPIVATHSNCRSIIPTDRHLSDEMILALVERGGVIGINLFSKFLIPPEELANRKATLADAVRHIRHICELAGNARHVGIGSDLDGGFGRELVPVEIESAADLPHLADALSAAGFTDSDITAILGENWRRYFATHLPA